MFPLPDGAWVIAPHQARRMNLRNSSRCTGACIRAMEVASNPVAAVKPPVRLSGLERIVDDDAANVR